MDVTMKTNTADALDVDVEEVMGMAEVTEAAYMAGEEASLTWPPITIIMPNGMSS